MEPAEAPLKPVLPENTDVKLIKLREPEPSTHFDPRMHLTLNDIKQQLKAADAARLKRRV